MLTRIRAKPENGGNLRMRPDGGVVTQRTANQLPLAKFRDSLHFLPSQGHTGFYGGNLETANWIVG